MGESFPKSQNRIYPLLKMSAAQMEKHLFNLKFASKQLLRDSKKCEKEEKAERAKLKKAMEKGNMEVARIHAENAIRQKNQALNFLRMSARVDAVASRVQTAVTTKRVTTSMQGVVKAMDSAMKSMNLERFPTSWTNLRRILKIWMYRHQSWKEL